MIPLKPEPLANQLPSGLVQLVEQPGPRRAVLSLRPSWLRAQSEDVVQEEK